MSCSLPVHQNLTDECDGKGHRLWLDFHSRFLALHSPVHLNMYFQCSHWKKRYANHLAQLYFSGVSPVCGRELRM